MSDQEFTPPVDGSRPRIVHSQPVAAGRPQTFRMPASSEPHAIEQLKVIYKRRWTAVATFTLVVLVSTAYSYTATPTYRSRVQILIEKESTNVVDFKQAFEQNQVADDYYQTQYKILQSRALARRTMDKLQLWTNRAFTAPPVSHLPTPRTLVSRAAGFAASLVTPRSTAPPRPPSETEAQSMAIDGFLAQLTVSPVKGSRLVDVTYTSTDPALAATIVNGLATTYIEQNLEFKFLASKEASDWLGERLAEQRKKVEASERALQAYREQTDAVSLEDRQNIVVQKLGDLNTAVTRAKTERIQKETAYNQIQAVQNDRAALDTIPAVLSNTYIQQQQAAIAELQRQQSQLSDNLGPNHPDMRKLTTAIQQAQAKLQAETAKIVDAIRNDEQAAIAQERSLVAALEQQKQEALSLNRKGIDYGALQRDAATNHQIFDSLLQRAKETGISGELRTSNIRIIDAAEPATSPSSPDKRRDLQNAMLGGGVISLVLVFFFEYIDNRIKSPEELTKYLGLPFLGLVPAVFGAIEKTIVMQRASAPSEFLESFRGLRTNILFSTTEGLGRTLAVTSTGPGEGKTLVSTNLAMALADAGSRVLLIDADMRKSRVHGIFEVAGAPGLSNVLVGNAKASDAIRATAFDNLWILPAGVHPPNPPELLGSARFVQFLAKLETHFDWVVIDTPPIMAVTDPCVAAHAASAVIMVVGSEMTNRHAAHRAVEQLRKANPRVIGAVLNRVDLKHHPYYYSHYYRSDYAEYYQREQRSAS
jgi:succinoglycan biosynthesis transport protein ExoP